MEKWRLREKENTKGVAKASNLHGTSRTVRTRDGGPTATLVTVGTSRGLDPGLALRALPGGTRRLAPAIRGPTGTHNEVPSACLAAVYYGLGVTLASSYHVELEVR